MYGSKSWKEIVKENAHRSGGQESHKRWDSFFTYAEEPAHIDHTNGDRQSNIENHASHSQGRPPCKTLRHKKRELQTEAGIEGVEVQVEDLRVSRRCPLQEVAGEIFGTDQEKRGNKTQGQQFAGCTLCPSSADAQNDQAA